MNQSWKRSWILQKETPIYLKDCIAVLRNSITSYRISTKVIAGYKNRNSFKWLDGMNIILAKAGFLTRTKRITSSLAKQVDLASFEKQSSERYAKIYENYTASKEEKEALKQIEEYRKEKRPCCKRK